MSALKRDPRLSCQRGLRSAVNHADESVGVRKELALKASLRCFGKGIDLGKGIHSISGDAKDAIGELAIVMVRNLAKAAGRFVVINKTAKSKKPKVEGSKATGGHNTIKSKHVQAAKASLESTHD